MPQSTPNILIYPLQNNIHVSKVHCGSAFEPGASGLPYYCTPPVCVPAEIGALAVWRQNIEKITQEELRGRQSLGPCGYTPGIIGPRGLLRARVRRRSKDFRVL